MNNTRLSRRRFARWIGVGVGGPLIVPGATLGLNGAVAPHNRIAMGTIGLGARGIAVMRGFLRKPEVAMVALCDVDRIHYRDGQWGKGLAMGLDPTKAYVDQYYAKRKQGKETGTAAYEDYRDLIGRKDLDAVIVATPDHWHALIALEAVRNQKDVYCEKPVTHTFLEGQFLYREVANYGRVFQTGSQQRSDWRFRRAVELVRNGRLGRIRRVEVGLPAGYAEPRGRSKLDPVPPSLNYPFWCGPSPMLPYMRARHHRFWRGHSAYGGGNIMDWIGHHNDIAHWGLGLDESGPTRVEAVGWTFPDFGIYDLPIEFEIRCHYENGVEGSIGSRNRTGTKWVGEEGSIWVDRGRLEVPDPRWADKTFDPGPLRVIASDDHFGNFLESMHSRIPCVASAETGHRSVTPGHLSFVSQRLGRALRWDPQNESVLNDPEANEVLRSQDVRRPWDQA